ncbi:helix-turn-helix domain-containing protein [Cohnella algarum]|uniref:helix-turn-helix domain-containing protein n=1 Tax=Cohnella algarum TaxID=2044859 RepID=UPI001967C607|nr:helix-turn-helix domain-containing protein [Cohnella algarum]MBN2982537.1 helix-turn-helix domain-containing protein [Cohnella algarum]
MKLMIVDDDPHIRNGLAKAIPWEEHGFMLLDPASSAEEALSRFPGERPEIVLTDIEMKGITGLEMAARMKRSAPATEIVVLSGYGQFSYMQQAIREGVGDYILKTSGPDEIVRVVLNAKRRLLDKAGRDRDGASGVLASGALEELLFHDHPPDYRLPNELKRLFDGMRPPSGGRELLQAIVVSVKRQDERMSAGFLHFTIRTRLQERFPSVALRYGKRMLVVLSRSEEREDDDELRRSFAELEKKLGCRLFVSAGSPVRRPEELAVSFREAETASRYGWFLDDAGFVAYAAVRGRKGIDPVFPKEEERELTRLIRSGDARELRGMAERLCARIRNDPDATPDSLYAYAQMLLTAGYRWLERTAASYGKALGKERMRLPSPEELLAGPANVLGDLLASIMDQYLELGSGTHHYIAEAIAYVRENLGRNVSLQQAAAHIHVNPNYLSDLFKRETGTNYIEFVTKERMERAKSLLSGSNDKIKDIARSVGYEDIKYFTGLFKRHTGQTPSEYRGKF